MNALLKEIKSCNLCQDVLPLEPKPILQFHRQSRILLVGQAPGIKAHNNNSPWSDASGRKLRDWLGVSEKDFYDPKKISIVPMGFCYPGKGESGDLPPRKECSTRWMDSILSHMTKLELILLIGNYSVKHFLGEGNLTEHIKDHAGMDSQFIVFPHPSPRNNIWFKKNDWFEKETLPQIRQKFNSVRDF